MTKWNHLSINFLIGVVELLGDSPIIHLDTDVGEVPPVRTRCGWDVADPLQAESIHILANMILKLRASVLLPRATLPGDQG